MNKLGRRSWWLVSALLLAGCTVGNDLYKDFEHAAPAKRMKAVIRAGEAKDEKAVPHMVALLTDSEPEVRMFTILALRKITGKTMNPAYRYFDRAAVRIEATEEWLKWARRHYGKGASTRPADGGSP